MADSRISSLAPITGVNITSSDVFVLVDVSDTTMSPEGTNKKIRADELSTVIFLATQFTEAVQDAAGSALQSSSTVAAVYNDAAGTYIHHVPSGALTSAHLLQFGEDAQDAVGRAVSSSTTVALVYDDSGNTISAHVIPGSLGTGALSFDVATQAELDAHINDTADAHDDTAVSVDPSGFDHVTSTDVHQALFQLDQAITAGGSYSDEQAQDAVGTILQSSTTWAVVYTDATPSIVGHVPLASLTTIHLSESVYSHPQTVETFTTQTYTLVIGDRGKWKEGSHTNTITVNIPNNASVAFPIGVHIDFAQANLGRLNFVALGAAKVWNPTGYSTRTTSAVASLFQSATDVWRLFGDTV